MDIHAKKGHKVVASHLNWGYDGDKAAANEHLVEFSVYTVDHTDAGGWSTGVYLKEFEGVRFNSVHFEDFEETP
jgi:hypothetical protein